MKINGSKKRGLSRVLIILIIIFAIVLAVFLFALKSYAHVNEKKCSFPFFTTFPITNGSPSYISPLGAVNPSDHTIPTDHIYFYFTNQTSGRGISQNQDLKTVNVVSPGEITVTSIKTSDYLSSSGSVLSHDYSIRFNVCNGINGYFYHLDSLSSRLKRSLIGIAGITKHCQKYQISSNGDGSVKSCFYNVNVKLNAGDLVGIKTEGASGLDFGLTNINTTLKFINPSRYYTSYANTVCPIDYFSSSVKSKLEGLLGSPTHKRIIPPVCGNINQDKAGTLQGNWFYGKNTKDLPGGWKKELSIIHNNVNFSMGEISIGGTIGPARSLEFTPLTNGTFDREPSGITPGNTIYCYSYSMNSNSRILLQLLNNDTLKAEEQQQKHCYDLLGFTSNAKIYNR